MRPRVIRILLTTPVSWSRTVHPQVRTRTLDHIGRTTAATSRPRASPEVELTRYAKGYPTIRHTAVTNKAVPTVLSKICG